MLLALTLACSPSSDSDSAPASARLKFDLDNVSAAGALDTSAGPVDIMIAPGLLVVHLPDFFIFRTGDKLAGTAMERLAEDGDPLPLAELVAESSEVIEVVVLAAQDATTYENAAMGPGGHASQLLSMSSDQRVSYVSMFGQSNDVVISTPPGGVSVLKPDGSLATVPLALFDAGTERNEEPGVGESQAPRQAAADTGESLEGTIVRIDGSDVEGWTYPSTLDFVSVAASVE